MAKGIETTKTELISQLEARVEKAKPIAKKLFQAELQRSTKLRLLELLKRVRVSRDGWDIFS